MTVKVISQPAFEPISRTEAKAWMSIGSDDANFDDIVDMLVKAMREDAENLTHRCFVQRALRLYLPTWPVKPWPTAFGIEIVLPYPPLASFTSFKYKDLNGDLQTLDPSQYVVHDWREPAIIVPQWNTIWPVIRNVPDAIQLDYVAGYPTGSPGDSESDAQHFMPAQLRLWMKTKAATLFQNREQVIVGNMVKIPRDFTDALLDSLIVGTRMF